jgi:hypothetical protein
VSQSPSNAVSGLKRRFKLAALVNVCAFAGAAAGLVLFFGMKVGAGLVLFVGSLVAGFAAQIWFMASFRRGGEGADQ